MKAGEYIRTDRENSRVDKRLSERPTDEESNQGQYVRVEGRNKWSFPGHSAGTHCVKDMVEGMGRYTSLFAMIQRSQNKWKLRIVKVRRVIMTGFIRGTRSRR